MSTLANVKLLVLPINAPAPSELSAVPVLKGTFSERVAAAEAATGRTILPLSGAEAAALAAHPEVFNLPRMLYISHVPGAHYDPMIDASIARLGAEVAIWDSVKAELLEAQTEAQRRDDRRSWDSPRSRIDRQAELPAAPQTRQDNDDDLDNV